MGGMQRALLALGLGLAGCSGSDSEPAGPARRVILISCDTLRADRLGVYGYDRPTTPHLDAFARDAVVFEEAYACAPMTGPALQAMMTGLLPDTIGVSVGNQMYMPSEVETIAELCRDAGLATGAVVSNYVVRNPAPSLGDVGLRQGFELYDDRMEDREAVRNKLERLAPGTTDAALSWLTEQVPEDDRFFLWVHYQDPHGPYTPPSDWAERFAVQDPDSNVRLPIGHALHGYRQIPSYQVLDQRDDANFYRGLYDAEIAYFDQHVGRLFAWLAEHDLVRDSLIVFTADHGEALGEHDFWFCHGENLYRELVRVPLVVRFPAGAPEPATVERDGCRRFDEMTSHLDLFPTIAAALGLEAAPKLGDSLLAPALPEDRVTVSQLRAPNAPRRWEAVGDGRFRLVLPAGANPQLFDLAKDPNELSNVANARPKVRDRLLEGLRALEARSPEPVQGVPMKMNREVRSKLRALGYTAGDEDEDEDRD